MPGLVTTTETIDATCDCGWAGPLRDVEDWAVEPDRDRVVRRCPGCGEAVPEWGTFPADLDSADRVARGPLRDALEKAGVSE